LQFKKAKEDKENHAAATWDASTFVTYQINVIGAKGLSQTDVLLDNQDDISIIHPSLLHVIEPAKIEITVNGVSRVQWVTNSMGYLQDFFCIYASADTNANMLSSTNVEDMYDIMYQKGKSFTVILPDRDLVFYRRKKFYMADFSELLTEQHACATKAYTKGELACADTAYEFVWSSSYPSIQEAIHLVHGGNLMHMPGFTGEDIRRGFDVYNEPVGSVQGKMTQKLASRAVYDDNLISDNKKQVLHTDVMHINGKWFLITVRILLHLMMQCPVKRETASMLVVAL